MLEAGSPSRVQGLGRSRTLRQATIAMDGDLTPITPNEYGELDSNLWI